MYLISSPSTFLTLLGKILGISLHGGLVVSLVQSHLPQLSATKVSCFLHVHNFHPIGKQLSGYQYPNASFRKGVYGTYKVQSPTVERVWSHSWVEALMASMYLISSPLTFLTLLGEILGISLHGGLVVSLVQSHLPQLSATRVSYWLSLVKI